MRDWTFKLEHIMQMDDDLEGGCINCGFTQPNVDPDGENYNCENCGEDAVYGAQQLAIIGRVV